VLEVAGSWVAVTRIGVATRARMVVKRILVDRNLDLVFKVVEVFSE
jgi:hypothetical protein